MTDLNQAIATAIIAHSPGWTPARELDLTGIPGLGAATTLEYRYVEIHEQVEASAWTVTEGWRVALLDAAGDILLRHVEPYTRLSYPDDEYVRDACRHLVAAWRSLLDAARRRRELAEEFVVSLDRHEPRRVAVAAAEIEAGRLALAETAAALGVDPQAIQDVLDRRALHRWRGECEAEADAFAAANPLSDEEWESRAMQYTSAAELAADTGRSEGTVRRALSRAGVTAHHYVGRYRRAMYPRGAAEEALNTTTRR